MVSNIFILGFLTIFTLFYFIVGIIASRKIANVNDYLFAGKNLSLAKVAFGLVAVHLGGGLILGTSQKAYELGIIGIFYTIGITLGFVLLACGWAAKLQILQIDTIAELFQKYYKSITLRKIASFISIITLSGILVAQIIALKGLLSAIGAYNEYIFLGVWLLIIVYTLIGGLHAVAIIDSIQVAFIIVVLTALFIYFITIDPSSINKIFNIQKSYFDNTNYINLKSMFLQYLPVIVAPALFSCIEQDLAQKFLAAKSSKVATQAAIMAGAIITMLALIPVYFGMIMKYYNPALDNNSSPFIAFMANNTNQVIFAIIICAIIAAITSTADSLLCAISSNISQDFEFSIFKIKDKLLRSKMITLFTGLVALLSSYIVKPDIINIIIKSYEISICTLLMPIVYSVLIHDSKFSKKNAYFSIIAGALGFIITQNIFVSLGLSAISFWIPKAKLLK